MQFELNLTKFIAVTVPFAKAIKCLESTLSTAADVYKFWLAAISQLVSLFDGNQSGLLTSTVEAIREIVNHRFDGMFNVDVHGDLYFACLWLDPGLYISPVGICIILT